MELITTFEQACERKGLDPEKVIPAFEFFPEHHRVAMQAISKIVLIAEVLNDGWVPDWTDGGQPKFYPWFWMNDTDGSSGSRFSYGAYDIVYSFSAVGSRLCFKSRELAKYAGTLPEFQKLYEQFFVMTNEKPA